MIVIFFVTMMMGTVENWRKKDLAFLRGRDTGNENRRMIMLRAISSWLSIAIARKKRISRNIINSDWYQRRNTRYKKDREKAEKTRAFEVTLRCGDFFPSRYEAHVIGLLWHFRPPREIFEAVASLRFWRFIVLCGKSPHPIFKRSAEQQSVKEIHGNPNFRSQKKKKKHLSNARFPISPLLYVHPWRFAVYCISLRTSYK